MNEINLQYLNREKARAFEAGKQNERARILRLAMKSQDLRQLISRLT